MELKKGAFDFRVCNLVTWLTHEALSPLLTHGLNLFLFFFQFFLIALAKTRLIEGRLSDISKRNAFLDV